MSDVTNKNVVVNNRGLTKKGWLIDETSACFTISNGVHQGGILSPMLLSIYMDHLSLLLSESRIGCHIDDLCINLAFDDLDPLMASYVIALQKLISVEIDLNFNATKSYCVAFIPKLYLC